MSAALEHGNNTGITLLPLAGRWQVWDLMELRSAGFCIDQVLALADPQLVDLLEEPVERLNSPQLLSTYRAAEARQSVSLAAVAREPRFREAITWQNPNLIGTCLDKVAAGSAAKKSLRRRRELTVARYLQRYCTKNETIGFFGPTAWGRLTDAPSLLHVRHGEGLLARRTIYFEQWAIDEVRRALGVAEAGFVDDPELALRDDLQRVGMPEGVAALDELIAARDGIAACAGNAEALHAAMSRLDAVFEQITNASAQRRPGETYAGRRTVYEDTLRDASVELGLPFRESLGAALALLLDSADWFTAEVAEAYRGCFESAFERCSKRLETDAVPLTAFFNAVTPDLAASHHELPRIVADIVVELRRRWSTILQIPDGALRHHASSGDIAAHAAALFPVRPPTWSSAVHHSPDLMIAATDVAAIDRGDFVAVMGEIHLAMNTFDNRCTTQQRPDVSFLAAADAADRQGRRVVAIPAKRSAAVNSRTYPPVLLASDYLYWTAHRDHTGSPGPISDADHATVQRGMYGLVVLGVDPEGPVGLLEVLGEHLSAAVMSGFSPLPGGEHRPRVSIDRLVVARESWTLPCHELTWTRAKDPVERYRGALRWRFERGIPRRAFHRVQVEPKPMFVDFASIALVEILASAVRRAVDDDLEATVSLTEMLPDLGEQWLQDDDGAAFTCELRLVTVAAAPADRSHRISRPAS